MLNLDYQVPDSLWQFTPGGGKCEPSSQYDNKEPEFGQLPLKTYSLAQFAWRYPLLFYLSVSSFISLLSLPSQM